MPATVSTDSVAGFTPTASASPPIGVVTYRDYARGQATDAGSTPVSPGRDLVISSYALTPGGVLIFDVAEPGRCRGLTQRFAEGDDWTCLVEYQHAKAQERLTRRIVSFRKVGDTYRRHEEFFALHDVAERMLDFDERMQIFRFHHLKLAQRIIGGGVIGTMGTPVEVLQQRMQHIAYRELWDLRNQITENANPPGGKQTS